MKTAVDSTRALNCEVDIDCGGSERKVCDLEFCGKGNVRREDVGELVGEVSSLKAKKCKKEFEFEHLVMLTRKGNLTRGGDVDERGNLTRK